MGEPVKAEIVLYQSEGANVPVQVRYMNETLWLPQREIADLFGTSKQTISYHMGNIFGDGELDKESVVKEILTTAYAMRVTATTHRPWTGRYKGV